jgi:hypothetical protein
VNPAVTSPDQPAPRAQGGARAVFLPREHGSWSIALEPIALGLLVVPTAAGVGLSLAAASVFFARRPLRSLVLQPGPRHAALAATALLGLFAAAGLAGATIMAGPASLWPLLLAAPFGALFLAFDLRRDPRAAVAEAAGAAAFSMVPAAIAAAGGWPARPALALGAVMCARSVPTVVLVRGAVRRAKGLAGTDSAGSVASLLGLAVLAALPLMSLAPWTVAALGFLLLVRAVAIASARPDQLPPRRLGIAEAIVGVVFILTVWAAYRLR